MIAVMYVYLQCAMLNCVVFAATLPLLAFDNLLPVFNIKQSLSYNLIIIKIIWHIEIGK